MIRNRDNPMIRTMRFAVAAWLVTAAAAAAEGSLQLATFRADMTPPIGDGLCVGFMPRIASVEHPLEMRGIVLRSGERTFVLAALDYQGLCNSSDDQFRTRMADAAGTIQERGESHIGKATADGRAMTVTLARALSGRVWRGLCRPSRMCQSGLAL